MGDIIDKGETVRYCAGMTDTPKRRGRPAKPPGLKFKNLTTTVDPAELAALEKLRGQVNAGLPAQVTMAALVRLALARLGDLTPVQIRKALIERAKTVG